jgi:hypothetical protein
LEDKFLPAKREKTSLKLYEATASLLIIKPNTLEMKKYLFN